MKRCWLLILLALPALAIPPLDKNVPSKVETATFGLGCYWDAEAQLGVIPGIVRTRVGWGRGAEVVQVDFDPEILSYQVLLERFWGLHNPCANNGSRLYARLIMTHSAAQERLAQATLTQQEKKRGRKVTTLVEPVNFSLAQDSDQKYYLRNSGRPFTDLSRHFASFRNLVNSTAAARLNGYLAGRGSPGQRQKDLPLLGLSESVLSSLP